MRFVQILQELLGMRHEDMKSVMATDMCRYLRGPIVAQGFPGGV